MECRFIYPIFYYVNPLELQHETGNYGEVFARLGKMFKEEMQIWRLALSEAANSRGMINLSSCFVGSATVDYEDTIKWITGEVSARLAIFPFSIWDDLEEVYESRVQEVISLVDVDREVKMVGICCGGRSTIARAVCNSIARHFEDLCYFYGVHEIARGYASTWDDFQNRITQPWFPQRKILVILEIPDGAKELDQLWAIRECDRFGEGSRIIVTASDKNLLVTNGIEMIMDDIEDDPNDQRHKLREKINKRKREDTESHT
ncbi:hypothetical protein QN277_012154 [Acacia crassicarpa]|uniref:TIR domain-containing protein n=1 Tax=Acacia crassicarpa TaxID=499986 RepID=A0AAE1N0K2_9FABA|nr:hypothetical protein QN277_012154 [Acacia crassicarpa]